MRTAHPGPRGQQVLAYIAAARRPPSYAAIARDLGFTTISDVANVVRRLERRGLLRRADTGSRHRNGWHEPVLLKTQTTKP